MNHFIELTNEMVVLDLVHKFTRKLWFTKKDQYDVEPTHLILENTPNHIYDLRCQQMTSPKS